MIRLLVSLLLLYIGWRVVKAILAPKKNAKDAAPDRPAGEETVQDPVCGVYVVKNLAIVGNHEGTRHYFCSMDCLEKFRDQLDHTPHS